MYTLIRLRNRSPAKIHSEGLSLDAAIFECDTRGAITLFRKIFHINPKKFCITMLIQDDEELKQCLESYNVKIFYADRTTKIFYRNNPHDTRNVLSNIQSSDTIDSSDEALVIAQSSPSELLV